MISAVSFARDYLSMVYHAVKPVIPKMDFFIGNKKYHYLFAFIFCLVRSKAAFASYTPFLMAIL